MFSSPEGSFQAVIYLHRYTRDTVNLLLNDYVREFIGKLEEKHRQQTIVTLNESARPGDRPKPPRKSARLIKCSKRSAPGNGMSCYRWRSNAWKLTSMTV